ncbi:MAG: DapH/DapD/GlmU-related protein [Aquabacterium sp.]|nr:DapH/DapD/GlmU-related protein [Aquabacterium sp.]
MIRHFINILLWFLPPSRLFGLRRWLLALAGVDLAADACYCGRGWVYGRGVLRIGAGSWLSPGVIAHTHAEAAIEIGAACDIGPGVEFIPGSHEIGGPERRAGRGTARGIRIGTGCWIGAGSRILGGVTLGPGVIVAAGCVVTQDMPGNTLVAGVPGRVKRELDR